MIWLALYAAVIVIFDDHHAAGDLAPTAFLAAGYLFGDAVIRQRRNGKNGS